MLSVQSLGCTAHSAKRTYLIMENIPALRKGVNNKMKAIVINPNDNVATAISDISTGSSVKVRAGDRIKQVKVREDIPRGHKFALARVQKGEHIMKYGQVIGVATNTIGKGKHVHVHNVESRRGRGDLARRKRA